MSEVQEMMRHRQKYLYEEPPVVVHRSANRMILENDHMLYKPKKDLLRGWLSPENVPYRPIGNFQKVVPVIEEIK